MNGTRQHSAGRERGAALIVAIGVLTLLLVIALTFFRASIGDVRTSQNTVDGVRAELLADGATAIAIGFLNHDRAVNPTYTSLDRAWRSYFNGTFAAAKPHLWAPVQDPAGNGVHRMSLLHSKVPDAVNNSPELVDRAGIIEIDRRLIRPDTLSDWLYIPRQDFGIFPSLGGPAQATAPADYVTVDPASTDPSNPLLQNPFVVTADLADPSDPTKFSPLFELINDTRLFGSITFQADRNALEARVYDAASPPEGRLISLNQTVINAQGLTNATNETLPYEQVHFIADVDNDGDGLNDSMWIPAGSDRYFPEDGLDNDLDGYIDAEGLDVDGDGVLDFLPDLDGEPGVFLYRGDTDGIDNNFDGIVDEDDEYFFVTFTVPMPWRADLDGNGYLDRVNPTAAELTAMGITANDIVRYEGDVNPTTLEPIEIGAGRIGNFIYSRDNDYDLVLDQPVDASHYMLTAPYDVNNNGRPDALDALQEYMAPGTFTIPPIPVTPYLDLLVTVIGQAGLQVWQNNGFQGAPMASWGVDGFDNDGDGMIDEGDEGAFVIQGETVTELTGRMAILITDEASKVNINASGGWTYPVLPDLASLPAIGPLLGLDSIDDNRLISPLQRAFAAGIGPHEFDTRVVPGVGVDRSRWMWQYLMGARQGYFAQGITLLNPFGLGYYDVFFEGDATLPGFGYVDDNANLMQLALSRKNNRGGPNFLLDINDPTDVIDPTFDRGLLGEKWDGIDEPAEYQPFRPLHNPVAELGGADEDGDDIVDEIGEIGDQYYRTHQQLKLISAGTFNNAGFEGVRGFNDEEVFNELRNFFTAHSNDRNERHFHQDLVLASFRDAQSRQTTGQRKDLNLTRAGDVARTVKRDWTFPASLPEVWSTANGALDQRASFLTNTDLGGQGAVDFLRGLRQENVSVLSEDSIMDFQPTAGNVFTILADAELRVHQTAATLKDFADLDYTRSVDDQIFADDLWWRATAANAAPGSPAELLARSQRIYYTTAGLEAVRINEINVRPVRRLETESVTDLFAGATFPGSLTIDDVRGLDPNRFVPHGGTYPPVDDVAAALIEEEGFRVRMATTASKLIEYNDRVGQNYGILGTQPDGASLGEMWTPRPLVAMNGTFQAGGLLGLEAAWATYRRYIPLVDPDDGPDETTMVPDVVQFSIQATDSLPAGRYYLTVNTQWVDADGVVRESVRDTNDFQFAIKTGTYEQDWFVDAMNIDSYVRGQQIYNPWRTPALLGSAALGGSQGMAFLQGDAFFRFNPGVPAGTLFTSNNIDFALNNELDRNFGFTIEIPERDLSQLPVDDQWIHIAFRRAPGTEDGRGFVVNYLDFSQEPDHEWVEVVNQSNDIVDISGWQLAVEAHPLGIGPMTVPNGTLIAPRGMVLLGTNKFDYGYNGDDSTGVDVPILVEGPNDSPSDRDIFDRGTGFFTNGIGLAAGDLGFAGDVFTGVTVPQTFPEETLFNFFDGVFYRSGALPADFIDRDGDGIEDNPLALPPRPDDQWTSTIDPVIVSGVLPQAEDKAWDRIVELIVPDLVSQTPSSNFSAAEVGRIVLGGGIFPNRPEYDATDNDGDNRVLGSDNRDNDGDGNIDEAGEADGIDNDGDGVIDELFEGFNEGRYARDQQRQDRVQGLAPMPIPGGFNADFVPYQSLFFSFDTDLPDFWTGGANGNPPLWKEFLERRNFPGDAVIVTLYEGPANEVRPADRITYTQRDVENRQIDDVIMVTDFDMDTNIGGGLALGETNLGDVGVQDPLDNRFESFWPENTMGQDFARSLERKHPDYTGDRFGTQNRFQATDGNYDDWSESTGRWERILSIDALGDLQDVQLEDRRLNALFNHAFGGSPLRRNVSARIAEYLDTDFSVDPPAERASTFAAVNFRNRPLVSPGDALTMPHTSRRQALTVATANPLAPLETYLIDMASPNIRDEGGGTNGRGDRTYDSVMPGQRFDDSTLGNAINFFHDLRAFIGDVGTTDAVSLNVGQATVIQVLRGATGAATTPDEAWPVVGGDLTGRPPQTWAPLMMFELTGATSGLDDVGTVQPYGYERQYLFQPLVTLPATVDTDRWPMPTRTALYASRNFDDFGPGDPQDGAQAVFVWDGDDGLENGEYELYVVTTEDLSLFARADTDMILNDPNDPDDPFNLRLLTDNDDGTGNLFGGRAGVGEPFVDATQATANNEIFLDIEAFRDSNGDRKAWDPDLFPGDSLNDNQLQRGQPIGTPFESFGVVRNAQPDADGVIRYGNVRVENNFLAVSIRNRSASGNVARISRVVLAARGKTPGRININTVETKRINNDPDIDDQYANYYNPLTGLPGVLERRDDNDAIGQLGMFVDDGDVSNVIVENIITSETDNERSAVYLARQIVNQRLRLLREQPDGRYYELTSDLMADAHFARIEDHPATPTADDAGLRPPLVVEQNSILPDINDDNAVDANAIRAGALREGAYRFAKMQNLITVKSEVFEILVTVQSGYGTDADGDGRINWRDSREFTPMAEKTARTIYER